MPRAPATIHCLALVLCSAAWLACAAPTPETAEPALAPKAGPELGARAISESGSFQSWVIELRDTRGAALTGAAIAIAGGMPGHGHGLPTDPRVTEELGGGRYRIEGMKLNMVGAWVFEAIVETRALRDRLRFDLAVDY
jgi:hypothetical protein